MGGRLSWSTDADLAQALIDGESAAQELVYSRYQGLLLRKLPPRTAWKMDGSPDPEHVVSDFLASKLVEPKTREALLQPVAEGRKSLRGSLICAFRNYCLDGIRRGKRRAAGQLDPGEGLDLPAQEPGPYAQAAERDLQPEPRTPLEAAKRLLALARRAQSHRSLTVKRCCALWLDLRLLLLKTLQEDGTSEPALETAAVLSWSEEEAAWVGVEDGPTLGEVWEAVAERADTPGALESANLARLFGCSTGSLEQWRKHARRILRETDEREVSRLVPNWLAQCQHCLAQAAMLEGTCQRCGWKEEA